MIISAIKHEIKKKKDKVWSLSLVLPPDDSATNLPKINKEISMKKKKRKISLQFSEHFGFQRYRYRMVGPFLKAGVFLGPGTSGQSIHI